MKILMLTPYLPYPLLSGGQIRTFNLLKNLKDKHEITLFSLIKNESDRQYVKDLEPLCHKVRVFKRSSKPFTLKNILRTGFSLFPFVVTRNLVPATMQGVKEELALEAYDLIHAETFYMMPNIPKTSIPTILVEQTIEYLGYQSYTQSSKMQLVKPLLQLDIMKIKFWEKYYWRHCDRLITMSDDDKSFIAQEAPEVGAIEVVANGVDASHFDDMERKEPAVPTALFVGTFSWLPNVQAVTYLVEEVWPHILKQIPEARLKIVGFSPTEKVQSFDALSSVTVSGSIPDIRDAYASSTVLVAPVRWGKGTRYKILEAMATKTPIVATSIAVEGITGVKDGVHVLLGEDAEALANQAVKVMKDHDLRARMAKKSYELVTKAYNWRAISEHLDRVYQEIGSQTER